MSGIVHESEAACSINVASPLLWVDDALPVTVVILREHYFECASTLSE